MRANNRNIFVEIDSAGGDYVTSGSFNTSNGEVTLTRLSGGTVVYDLDGRYLTGVTAGDISFSGTPNYLAKFDSSSGLTDSIIFNTGSTVGINTIDPQEMVELQDTLGANQGVFLQVTDTTDGDFIKFGIQRDTGNGFPGIWLNQASPSVTNFAFLAGNSNNSIFNTPSGTNMGWRIGNEQKMRISSSGGISIGDGYADENTGSDAGADNLIIEGGLALGATSITQKFDVHGNSIAYAWITSGGTSSQFVKGDGSLDSTVYLPEADFNAYTASTGSGSIIVEEFGGSPSVSGVTKIVFSGGTVIDDGGGQVTVQSSGGGGGGSGISWTAVTGNTTCEFSTGYIANSASLITFTLPTTNLLLTIRVTGKGSGGWQVDVPASWTIYFAGQAVTDNLQSNDSSDSIELLGLGDNAYQVISSIGNITFNNL